MIIYKNSDEDEEKFIESIFRSISKRVEQTDYEALTARLVSNPNLGHRDNMLFYHWYERVHEKNIHTSEVLKGLNPSNKYISKRTIEDEIIDRRNQFMGSTRFPGYTVFYEYYFDFFPDIEQFSFEEFCGREFYDYFLGLFPTLDTIKYRSQKQLYRRSKKDPAPESGKRYELEYKVNPFPIFRPFKEDSYRESPESLMNIERNEVKNIVRQEHGLPKVGEGWISETQLYYLVKESFPDLLVQQHASPNWLGRQHLDVYIPEFNIGIEYQGVQHSRPVDFFGGKQAFKRSQERDARKKMLATENECQIIYVYPAYKAELVLAEIREAMKKKR